MTDQENKTTAPQPEVPDALTEEEMQALLSGRRKPKKEASAPTFDETVFRDDPRIQAMNQDFARQTIAEAHGEEAPVYGPIGALWKFKHKYFPDPEKRKLNKKTYILLLVFLGWMGGHRWYQKHFMTASFMTLFCWTGLPLLLCVTDLMEVIPVKADENGEILF